MERNFEKDDLSNTVNIINPRDIYLKMLDHVLILISLNLYIEKNGREETLKLILTIKSIQGSQLLMVFNCVQGRWRKGSGAISILLGNINNKVGER